MPNFRMSNGSARIDAKTGSILYISDGEIYLWVTQSIYGDVMLNPIEKFKVAILHLNRDWNH